MAALRTLTADGSVRLIDLGPMSAHGNVYDGGRLAVPVPEPRPEGVCRDCGGAIRETSSGAWGHAVAYRVGAMHPRHMARPAR